MLRFVARECVDCTPHVPYGVEGTEVGTGSSSGSSTSGTASLPWDQLKNLSIHDFSFTIPSVTFTFVKNNSDAEVLAKPQLRISEGEKAQLVIGERVPIPDDLVPPDAHVEIEAKKAALIAGAAADKVNMRIAALSGSRRVR